VDIGAVIPEDTNRKPPTDSSRAIKEKVFSSLLHTKRAKRAAIALLQNLVSHS
jgi:hypothetical protein